MSDSPVENNSVVSINETRDIRIRVLYDRIVDVLNSSSNGMTKASVVGILELVKYDVIMADT
jgi:hypothetical protein